MRDSLRPPLGGSRCDAQARISNFDPLSNQPNSGAEAASVRKSAIFGGFTGLVDPGLEGQYLAEGRTPASYELDLNLAYPFEVGSATIHLQLSVFNLLDAQRAILVDPRWGLQEADNAVSTPANPGYGRAALRTPPTSARFGVRVSF